MAAIFKPKFQKNLLYIHISSITPNPNQPREKFDNEELFGLAESIKKNGIIQPLAVRRLKGGKYELISGERRLRAAKIAGLEKVPCLELDVDEKKSAVLSLLENIQRQDLTFFEEAEAISRLVCEWGISQQEAAERLGKAQSTLANKLRLLKLSKEQRDRITKTQLTERHARALLRIPDEKLRDEILDEIIIKDYNVWETEQYINKLIKTKTEKPKRNPIIGDIRLFINTIEHAVDTMRQSGVDAQAVKNEDENKIEYSLIIPKTKAN